MILYLSEAKRKTIHRIELWIKENYYFYPIHLEIRSPIEVLNLYSKICINLVKRKHLKKNPAPKFFFLQTMNPILVIANSPFEIKPILRSVNNLLEMKPILLSNGNLLEMKTKKFIYLKWQKIYRFLKSSKAINFNGSLRDLGS